MVLGGLGILIASGRPGVEAIKWAILASGMSGLAIYASVAYRRLRFREQALREATAVAQERARARTRRCRRATSSCRWPRTSCARR